MKILFTGASSFTGFWFVRALVASGHQVTAIFQSEQEFYQGIRAERVRKLLGLCEPVFSCYFGSEQFKELIQSEIKWDLLCHHAAHVVDYRSSDFDPFAACMKNTHHLPEILELLKSKQCQRILLTGSIFEAGEGAGSQPLHSFSPYGLSKTFTCDYFRYYCHKLGLHLGKFCIPNPFGPFEEPRFTSYLIQSWFSKQSPHVKTPDYIRDNIPVDLLAKAYASFASALPEEEGFSQLNPSGYVESQGAFTNRCARELQPRLKIPCPFKLDNQVDFPEPRIRINTDALDWRKLNWSEEGFWDEFASFHKEFTGGQ